MSINCNLLKHKKQRENHYNLKKNENISINKHVKFTIQQISAINRNIIKIIPTLLTINRINITTS